MPFADFSLAFIPPPKCLDHFFQNHMDMVESKTQLMNKQRKDLESQKKKAK